MTNLTIKIPDMLSAHCVMRVQNILKNIEGVNILNIQAGSAQLEVKDVSIFEPIHNSIESAGYTVESMNELKTEKPETSDLSEVYRFKTNINCGSCVAKVAPALNDEDGICNWNVDTTNKDKVLTIKPEGISEQEIIDLVRSKGFNAESI